MRKIVVVSLFLAAFGMGQAQVGAITLIVSIPQPDSNRHPVFVTGNFNYWHAGDTLFRLRPDGKGQYRAIIPVFANRKYEYKYTRGSWSEAEVAENDSNITNRVFFSSDQMTIWDTVRRWRIPAVVTKTAQEQRFEALKDSLMEGLKPELGHLMNLLKQDLENALQDVPDSILQKQLHQQAMTSFEKIFGGIAGLINQVIQSLSPDQKKELRARLQKAADVNEFISNFEKNLHEVTGQN